jgi:hypothetical protein
MFRVTDGEAVILDLGAGEYFGLNQVGSRIWELLARGQTVPELCSTISVEFEVSEEVAQADIEAFLETLLSANLIEVNTESVSV